MNNRVSRAGRTGYFISGKPEQIRKKLLALQQQFGPDMPLAYVLSLHRLHCTPCREGKKTDDGAIPQAG